MSRVRTAEQTASIKKKLTIGCEMIILETWKIMDYELDFIGVEDDAKQDENKKDKNADAIGIRIRKDDGSYRIGVYDGGFKRYGEALENLIEQYYSPPYDDTTGRPIIDFVICSHSDQDHVSGLKVILENFKVRRLYMNRPWLYIDEVFDKINDGRITKNSLHDRLQGTYQNIADLEEIAEGKSIPIYDAFQGRRIAGCLCVLSPSKDFYIQQIINSSKTPLDKSEESISLTGTMSRIVESIEDVIESWTKELLREDVHTTPENEQSVVLLGRMGNSNFLLTGDAGIEALTAAMGYAEQKGFDLKDKVSFYQIPHHGGRHNVSPSVLDRLLDKRVDKGDNRDKTAIASTAKDSDHPKQMVVNAFIRRGAKVLATSGCTICHHTSGMPLRTGWSSVETLRFSEEVEAWEDE